MSSSPPASPPVRGGWRIGLLVFAIAALVAAGFTIAPLLWPSWRLTELSPDTAGAWNHATSHRQPAADPSERARFRTPDWHPVTRLAITNLAPAIGRSCPLIAPTNNSFSLSSLAGGGVRGALSNSASRATKELPVFAALRASLHQPIPKEVADLAKTITNDCKTDADRAKAIYDWITGHITYDWKVWADIVAGANTYTEPQDPLSVIRRGTGVCAGYAWLFDALAASAGLDATFVIGDVRGYRGTSDDDLISKYLHAWNSVQIDGKWVLLDSTWGARQNGESATDYLARRDYYFQTPPRQLIFDHLPETDNWQLLDNPISTGAFQGLPNLKPAFFTDGLRLGSDFFSDAIATSAGKTAGVTITAPDGILIGATLSLNGQDISANNLQLRENGVRRDVIIGPLPAGNYILRIYAKPAANNGPYDCAADYAVKISGP